MKVSPPTSTTAQDDVPHHDDFDATNNCLKRRRLHSQTNIIINGHYRHRKHLYPRHDNKSLSMDCFDTISDSVNGNSNSSCNSKNSGEDASDYDDSSAIPNSYPIQQHPEGETSSPSLHHDKKDDYQQTTAVDNNNCNNEGDFMTPAIRNAVQQLTTNNGNNVVLSLSTHSEKNSDCLTNKATNELIISASPIEHPIKNATTYEKNMSIADIEIDEPTVTATADCIKSEPSNYDSLSQSPLNLTRSQGSSEDDRNKSEDDEIIEYDDEEEKNDFGNGINDDDENIVNDHNLQTTEVPFPWNITSGNINKQKEDHQDDKTTSQPPQLLLTSGQLTTGCLQAAQLLIPTARGIMTQTILAIPINDMVPTAITASTSNQQQLQQKLLYHSSNNLRQKYINRQQLNQTCQSSLPLNHYFQQNLTTTDDTSTVIGAPDNADKYNNIQRRKWHSSDLTNKKHNLTSPQQKQLLRTKNEEVEESINVPRLKESSMIQSPAGTNGDSHNYLTNSTASLTTTAGSPISPPTNKRNDSNNGLGVDILQRQNVWPTTITVADLHNSGDKNDNEENKHQPQQSSHVITSALPSSSANINNLKSVHQSSSQLNCHIKQSKDDNSAAAIAAAAYNQQNAICTALATHMMCASQLASGQPMFEGLDNSNASKKPNQIYNNNNNNIKTNNIMSVVNPAVLEKWMMEERYYYNSNNNNNNKHIPGGHTHHQRYNAAAAAAAVELLSGGVSTSSCVGGDSLASCKKRKRRTSFTPHALELLNVHFERNTHPSGSEITGLAHRLGYEREVIRIWFCNKRQALKNTVRTINGNTHMTSTKSHNNTSGY